MKINLQICALINGPLVFVCIVANSFYIFCMVRPLHGERIKQPLKLLLGSMIISTVTFLLSAMMLLFTFLTVNGTVVVASNIVSSYSLFVSMTSSVWLSFYYYTQIVPVQRAFFIWIKKNIKSVIYCVWLAERLYGFVEVSLMYIGQLDLPNKNISDELRYNFTMDNDTETLSPEIQRNMIELSSSMMKMHFLFYLCVMVMSNGSTVLYLSRHMRRMVANGQPLSCQRFTGQVRVTVTGIVQGVLYVICSTWTVYSLCSVLVSVCFDFTVINLYMSGTTFNLGTGQAVFRQRAADIWVRAQCGKAPKVQQSEAGG